jgi:alpha-amylase
MKKILRIIRWLSTLIFLTACAPGVGPATATVEPPSPTALSASATPEPPKPTATAAPPTLVPLPAIASTPIQPVVGLPQGTDGFPWWNDAVFYEIFVRSFYDSNGDGIGDFNGLTSKLDYLNDGDPNTTTDLGVTALWLMPINSSPSYHGYDVIDYYAVNPEYGTMDDFKHLLDGAHKRGIRVTIDWVLNHTSSQNEWFQKAKDPDSPFHNWYRWTTESFPGNGWRYGGGGGYYYAFFSEGMPDLNYQNPAVVAEMKKVARFWLKDVGIDGFRLDAAKYIVEDGSVVENTPETHAWYKDLRKSYKTVNPQAMTVGEVWDDSETVRTYLNGDELDLAFDFDLAKDFVFSAGTQTPKYASDTLRRDISIFRPGQFATFLTNHDQDRAMSVLNDNVENAKTAAMLLLTSPGVPFLYYGEEIGMLGKKPDENIRLPMQWSDESNAGFSTGSPWRAVASDFATKNVDTESADTSSLLSFYRALIHIRSDHVALRIGDAQLISSRNRAIFASLRTSGEETVLVLMNMSSSPVGDYGLNLESSSLSGNYTVNAILGDGSFSPIQFNEQGGFMDYLPVGEIPGFGRLILQLQKETQ